MQLHIDWNYPIMVEYVQFQVNSLTCAHSICIINIMLAQVRSLGVIVNFNQNLFPCQMELSLGFKMHQYSFVYQWKHPSTKRKKTIAEITTWKTIAITAKSDHKQKQNIQAGIWLSLSSCLKTQKANVFSIKIGN